MDSIYALSTGALPSAIAVVRLSGPRAVPVLEELASIRVEPRTARLATLKVGEQVLDNAIILHFRGPHSQTGEDVVEFHLHGGRAVVNALLEALSKKEGLRPAAPGEFTRRAFENGKIDLTGVEGLSDLVAAETENQRRAALLLADGHLSRQVVDWQNRTLMLSAEVEALLDMSDEGDVGEDLPQTWRERLAALIHDLEVALARPSAERLRDGVRVVIAGPPNSGKSSLLNALVGRDAAIVSPIAGTTRDVIEVPISLDGVPFLLSDTAGLRASTDSIEAIGVERAQAQVAVADILVWTGDPQQIPAPEAVRVLSKADLVKPGHRNSSAEIYVSAVTGEGLDVLAARLVRDAKALIPREGQVALNARHRTLVSQSREGLADAVRHEDLLIVAESLRVALRSFDAITGRAGVEDMLDHLFASLCIGK